jgi:hypothetical protein
MTLNHSELHRSNKTPWPRRVFNIASIVCLVLCVALMALWVRSYDYQDTLTVGITGTQTVALGSVPGRVLFDQWFAYAPHERRGWSIESEPVNATWTKPFPITGPLPLMARGTRFGFTVLNMGLGPLGTGHSLMLPFWFLVFISGSLAMAFQLRWPWRFTLRSLFIATTFLAVVLGMIAWLDRSWIGT